MKVISYVPLTPAQEKTLDALSDRVEVRTALLTPNVIATIRIFQAQEIKINIDANGVIQRVGLQDKEVTIDN
jgi:hypothetical protein